MLMMMMMARRPTPAITRLSGDVLRRLIWRLPDPVISGPMSVVSRTAASVFLWFETRTPSANLQMSMAVHCRVTLSTWASMRLVNLQLGYQLPQVTGTVQSQLGAIPQVNVMATSHCS